MFNCVVHLTYRGYMSYGDVCLESCGVVIFSVMWYDVVSCEALLYSHAAREQEQL